MDRRLFRLTFGYAGENQKRTSTKFAVLPSSSTPLVLKRVPALFELKREITAMVPIIGDPLVGGAGSGKSNIPTKPCIAST
jgi:hypothetical protein